MTVAEQPNRVRPAVTGIRISGFNKEGDAGKSCAARVGTGNVLKGSVLPLLKVSPNEKSE